MLIRNSRVLGYCMCFRDAKAIIGCTLENDSFFQILFQDCKSETVTTLKAIPSTSCDQKEHTFKLTPACPLVIENKVCEDVEKTFVAKIPREVCELHPREVCVDIVKQYPALQGHQNCKFLPRETCSPERVQPKEVTRPVIKKVTYAFGME